MIWLFIAWFTRQPILISKTIWHHWVRGPILSTLEFENRRKEKGEKGNTIVISEDLPHWNDQTSWITHINLSLPVPDVYHCNQYFCLTTHLIVLSIWLNKSNFTTNLNDFIVECHIFHCGIILIGSIYASTLELIPCMHTYLTTNIFMLYVYISKIVHHDQGKNSLLVAGVFVYMHDWYSISAENGQKQESLKLK